MKKIGKRLQELRESKGLSQVKVKLNRRFLELPYYFSYSCLYSNMLFYLFNFIIYLKSKNIYFVIIVIFYLFLFFLLKKE